MATLEVDHRFIPNGPQAEALKDTSREVLVGGNMAGGKTRFICEFIFFYCMKYAGARGVLARRKFTQLSTSTLETFRAVVPKEVYTYDVQKNIIRFVNGSKVFCTGLDMPEELDKFSSAELAFVAIDQAEEIEERHYLALITRLRQKKQPTAAFPTGEEYPYKIITSANPRICYLRDRFILSPIPGVRTFIPFHWKYNLNNLRAGYIDEQKANLKDNPALYASLIEGSWDITEEINTLIKYKHLLFCSSVGQRHIKAHVTRKGVSCDSARYGDDTTVIYEWEGTKITGAKFLKDQSVPSVASECLESLKRIGGNWIAIDTTSGLGAGSYDIMKQLTADTTYIQIYAVNSSNSPFDPKYLNVRAEMYFVLNEYIKNNIATLPNDPILIADLAAQTYEYRLDKLKITSKDDIKHGYTTGHSKRSGLGRSPDRGDACAIGIYALDKLVKDHEAYQEHHRDDRPYDYQRQEERVSYDNESAYGQDLPE